MRVAELLSGTVTFLFTDVEGSTHLVKQLRDGYGQVLAEHRRILRAAFEAHGGQEIDTQGDSFFVAFRRATEAALAAGSAQRALAEHSWPDGVDVRVRMGMHTGEPTVGDEGYHGLGVHRAARIMAAAHGGQVLLSQATCSVLEDDELPGIRVRDLGEHHLKDIDRPEHIHQLDIDGLPVEFPPLRTAKAPSAYTDNEAELERAARAALWRVRLRTRRWLAAAIVAFLVAVGLIAGLVLILGSGSAHALSRVDANAVGFVSAATGTISDEVPVGATPSHVASGEGAIWVTNADGNSVSRIDPRKKTVVETIAVGSSPSGIAIGNNAVWVANSLDRTVSRIDPGTNAVVQVIPVGNGPAGIVYAAGSVWVANTGDRTITRIDADSGRPTKPLSIAATELAFGAGTLWSSQRTANRVVRINPKTGSVVAEIPVGNGPTGLAYGSGGGWVANSLDGTVSRIDPTTNSVTGLIATGDGPTAVAVGAGSVWVSHQFGGTLAQIDPRTNRVTRQIGVGNGPLGVAISNDTVLVSVRQSGAGHRGGTLKVRLNVPLDSIDTAVAYGTTAWPILRMTSDGLVAFNQAGGLAGTQLVPDLALALPTATDGGRTYTFRLRPGIRYSSGRLLEASDFRSTLERHFEAGKVSQYYDGIVGASRCATGKRCNLSQGIVADDAAKTVAFHLVAPDPEFLYKLALDFTHVVPAGTRPRDVGTRPLPATGPYVIEGYRPKHGVTLVRNKYFHEWSKAAQPDGYPDTIVFEVGGTPDAAVDDVISGKADVFSTALSETPPSERALAAIKLRYASQVHANPQPATIALFLNTRVAPFNSLDVRRALNYAVDRAAAVKIAGGPDVAQATCQILPPNFPGYQSYCPYGTAPDLAKARALIAASGTRGMKIEVYSWSDLDGVGPYAVKLLRSLGYRVSMKSLGGFRYFGVVGDSRSKVQIGITEWISDYPAASGFFNAVLTCASFRPGTPQNANDAEFCDPSLDRQIARALTEQVTNPDAARGLWERVDRQAVDQAPWVPLVNPKVVDVLSKRVGNYQYSPAGLGMLFDQLWVQ
jgi:YVTN family beta-propeller protein